MSRPSICLFLILFVCTTLQTQAQQRFDTILVSKKLPHHLNSPRAAITIPKSFSAFTAGMHHLNLPVTTHQSIPNNFYSKNLGFFCAKELMLEKVTKIPFRFRLGSVQYTDKLEGKNAGR